MNDHVNKYLNLHSYPALSKTGKTRLVLKKTESRPANRNAQLISFQAAQAQRAVTLPSLGIAGLSLSIDEVSGILLAELKAKDPNTEKHSRGVSIYATALGAAYINDLKEKGVDITKKEEKKFLKEIEIAGKLHDIGKLRMPDDVLNGNRRIPPGNSERKELEAIINAHSPDGAEILKNYGLDKFSKVANDHHKPYKEVNTITRIIAVADIFEALTAKRTYKKGLSPEIAVLKLNREVRNGKLDPGLTSLFLKIAPSFYEKVQREIYNTDQPIAS